MPGRTKPKFRPLISETPQSHEPIHGRGASWSPANRFEKFHVDRNELELVDEDPDGEERPARATDCYQPVERKLRLTRGCLEVLAKFRNPVGILTKNRLVTRDIDILSELASHQAAAVNLSITTLDSELQRILEPRTSPPAARLEA